MQLVTILKEFSEAFTASDLRESTFDIEDIANTLLKSGDFKMTPTELAVVSENIIKILNNFGKINMNFGKPNVVFKRNTNTGKYTLSSVGILSERIKSINLEFSHEFDNVLEASRRSFLIPISKVSTSKQILIAQLLEMLHFASYEVISGERPEYFVRVNSIYAIERITKANDYHSPMVSLSWKKHQESIHIMEKFFEELETDKERWDYIEKYFIGESL
jgi:hypothetical protein